MAFFSLEDSTGVMECIAFPKVYTAVADLVREDSAVYVEGTLSVREEEAPKVLVSTMGVLVDNAHFSSDRVDSMERGGTPSISTFGETHTGGAQVAAARRAAASRPQASGGIYNPYESMPAVAPPPQRAAEGPAPRSNPAANPRPLRQTPPAPPAKIYLRVPDMEGEPYKKVLNLVERFSGRGTQVIFYDVSSGKYFATDLCLAASPTVMDRLERILGKENVVAK